MYFFRPLMYLPYLGCLKRRYTITTTLFIILLDTTVPTTRGLHSFPFPLNSLHPPYNTSFKTRGCVPKVLKLSSDVNDVSRRCSS